MFTRGFVLLMTMPLFALSATLNVRETCAREYTVKHGDTCDFIAVENNVSISQLHLNLGGLCVLVPRSTICLGYTGRDCTTTCVVGPDDSWGTIEDAFSINAVLLYGHNPQIDANCDNLYIGEVLCVSSDI
ncbi:hypothetical protein DFH08DRAFT_1044001 [Mycena albidolilacea]|uniref:LysM domain-containing protein n=1 Tax=Mycena albidolilacea TaxID=1033008 RepID=A0AAD7EDP7_9AGAR|nr:hypothetical protein DFH08DRAFT_1044001 [Mycena albidolilacea]